VADPYSNINGLNDAGRKLRTMPANSDAVDWVDTPKALLILTAGNIAVTAIDGNYDSAGTITATSLVIPVTAGQVFFAVRIKRMWSAGTTATFLGIF
jgi:hypothetical protein